MLSDLGLVSGDFHSHPDLNISKLPHQLVLFRILTQPSMRGDVGRWKHGKRARNSLGEGDAVGATVTGHTIHTRRGNDGGCNSMEGHQ